MASGRRHSGGGIRGASSGRIPRRSLGGQCGGSDKLGFQGQHGVPITLLAIPLQMKEPSEQCPLGLGEKESWNTLGSYGKSSKLSKSQCFTWVVVVFWTKMLGCRDRLFMMGRRFGSNHIKANILALCVVRLVWFAQ